MKISKNKATAATKPKVLNFLQLHLFQLHLTLKVVPYMECGRYTTLTIRISGGGA